MGLREAEILEPITEAEMAEWEARVQPASDAVGDLVLRLIAEVRRLRGRSPASAQTAPPPATVAQGEAASSQPDATGTTWQPDVAAQAPAIMRDPARCAGDPILAGTRTAVHDVVSYVSLYGGDLERVRQRALPHLSIEQIRAAMDWYHEHAEEIDEILRQCRDDYERGLAERSISR